MNLLRLAGRPTSATRSRVQRIAAAALVLLLSACGSGDAPPPDEIAPTTPPTVVAPVPPTITRQPTDVSTQPGQPATFAVAATGTAPLSYQWQRNGAAIADATSASYTIAATVIGDSGATFRVVVSNVAGSATSNSATLTVTMVAPTLTISPQPVNASVAAGATASFTVGGTCSSGTLAIQWQRLTGGTFVDIAGATSATYAFMAVSGDNGAQFRAVLSCSGLAVTPSNVVTLTVATPSALTLSLVPINGLRDQSPIGAANGIDPAPGGGWDFTSSDAIRHLAADLSSVTLVAGGPTSGSADGSVLNARFASPQGLVHTTTGITYVADTNNQTIRAIANGMVTTLAGTVGTPGFVNGTGTAASFSSPRGIALGPDGDLYVADEANQVIRRVTQAGVVTTYAGSGTQGFADNADPTMAKFANPQAVAVASNGDVYVADGGNNRVRRIARSGTVAGAVSTLAGSGSAIMPGGDGPGITAGIPFPTAMTLIGTTLYVKDDAGLLRTVDIGTGVVGTLAGSRTLGSGYADGPPGAGRLDDLSAGLAVAPNGALIVTDSNKLRTVDSAGNIVTIAVDSTFQTVDGTGLLAQLPFAFGPIDTTNVVVDATGRIDVSDSGTHLVRRIDTTGAVTLVAGLFGSSASGVNGIGSAAEFVDNGYTIAIAPDGTLYTSDQYGVARILTDGTAILLAGSPTDFGAVDGTATTARFNRVGGLAVGPTGDVFVGDFGNNAIRRVDAAGNTTTYAGALGVSGFVDGPRLSARFQFPRKLAFAPDGTLYVVDNGALRRIATDGTVSTLGFNSVLDVAVDSSGIVYETNGNGSSQHVATVDPVTGTVTNVIGTGTSVVLGNIAPSLGPAPIGSIYARGPRQIVIESQNELLLLTIP